MHNNPSDHRVRSWGRVGPPPLAVHGEQMLCRHGRAHSVNSRFAGGGVNLMCRHRTEVVEGSACCLCIHELENVTSRRFGTSFGGTVGATSWLGAEFWNLNQLCKCSPRHWPTGSTSPPTLAESNTYLLTIIMMRQVSGLELSCQRYGLQGYEQSRCASWLHMQQQQMRTTTPRHTPPNRTPGVPDHLYYV
jgi:hypothetical protein